MEWDAARCEAYLFDYCNSLYRTEVEAYQRLQHLQGRNIPKLFDLVRFRLQANSASASSQLPSPALPSSAESSSPEPSMGQPAFFEVPGILVEYIDGFSLTDLAVHAPPAVWQSVCDEAIRIVNLIGDHGILNDDVKTRNVLVRAKRRRAASTHSINGSDAPNGAGTRNANDAAIGGGCEHYDVVFIDFGHCRFREADETDAEWMHKKNVRDEEGAIGVVMESKLRAHGGGFEYHRTNHFSCRCSECVEVI
jgi:serine/threonine protein kinase